MKQVIEFDIYQSKNNMNKTFLILATVTTLGFTFYSFQKKPAFDLKASVTRGKEIYQAQCLTCHQESGEGLEDVYPPLAKSDYLMADKKRSIVQVIKGATGAMKVNGKEYNMEMTGFDLSDQEVSDVLNYVRNSWSNKGNAVTPEEVKAARR
jgi:mono/diheme cytochrome c family protein